MRVSNYPKIKVFTGQKKERKKKLFSWRITLHFGNNIVRTKRILLTLWHTWRKRKSTWKNTFKQSFGCLQNENIFFTTPIQVMGGFWGISTLVTYFLYGINFSFRFPFYQLLPKWRVIHVRLCIWLFNELPVSLTYYTDKSAICNSPFNSLSKFEAYLPDWEDFIAAWNDEWKLTLPRILKSNWKFLKNDKTILKLN